MIVNGASRRSVAFWSRHLANDKKNDRAELKEIRGLAATSLKDALLEMQEDARHTRCQNFFYQANFNPCAHEHLTEDQWERAFDIFEKHRGIPEGTARVVYEHEKEGRVHRHVIWSRIDLETMKAWPDRLDAKVCHAASREISQELGLQRSPSPYDRDREGPRPERAPKPYEMFRGLRSGIDPREVKREVTRIFRDSAHAGDFVAGLREHGYQLVRGDKRDFCILDPAGDVHSLARRIDGVKAKDLREFMRGIDREALPGVEKARMRFLESNLAARRADLATVAHEIAWEEKLARAAIEKEKIEGRFKEPTPRDIRERDRREKDWPLKPPQSGPVRTSPHYHFDDVARETARPEPEPVMPANLKGDAARIWQAYHTSDNARAFAAALREEGISLAAVTKEEADRSYRLSAFARETGRFAPRYREGEIVAVVEPSLTYRDGRLAEPRVYQLNRRTTGEERAKIATYLKSLDRTRLRGIEATKENVKARAEERIVEVQAFRDLLRDARSTERMKKAGDIRVRTRTMGGGTRGRPILGRAVPSIGLGVATGVLKSADKIADAFSSLFDPILTPAQKLEGRIAQAERDEKAQQQLDSSKYAAEQSVERRRDEEQRHRDPGRER